MDLAARRAVARALAGDLRGRGLRAFVMGSIASWTPTIGTTGVPVSEARGMPTG